MPLAVQSFGQRHPVVFYRLLRRGLPVVTNVEDATAKRATGADQAHISGSFEYIEAKIRRVRQK